MLKDDKVMYSAVQPEYKEAIKYFNKLYSEGLVDKEALVHDNSVYTAKTKNTNHILGSFIAWSLTYTFGTTQGDYVAIPPLKGPKGLQMWCRSDDFWISKGAFAVSASCKNPEVAIRWADQMYDADNALQASLGMYGEAIKKNSDGSIENLPVPEGMTLAQLRHKNAPGVNALTVMPKEIASKIKPNADKLEKMELHKMYQPYVADKIYSSALVWTLPEELKRLQVIDNDISTYVKSNYARWLLMGNIDNEWEAYIEKLNKIGLQEKIKIHQAAYDRYKDLK